MDNRNDTPDQTLKDCLFGIEGDNIMFRGLDTGRVWGEYACPLFEGVTAHLVARYISTPRRNIRFNRAEGTFQIYVAGDQNQYLLKKRKVDNVPYYDFGGTARWVKG